MNLFVVTKEGVYRHDIVGIFDNEAQARGAADAAIRAEPDAWHSFDVIRMVLGQPGEHKVCRYDRDDTRHIENGHYVIDSFKVRITETV